MLNGLNPFPAVFFALPLPAGGQESCVRAGLLLEEILFESANLLVEQVVGLVNQADGDIGNHFSRTGFHKLP